MSPLTLKKFHPGFYLQDKSANTDPTNGFGVRVPVPVPEFELLRSRVMYYLDDNLSSGNLPDGLRVTADWPDVTVVATPARHLGHQSIVFNLPGTWASKAHDPACEVRVAGVNSYDGNPTPAGQVERGDEVWMGFSIMFPKKNTAGESVTFCQWHMGKNPQTGNKGPYLALRLLPDNSLQLRRRTMRGGKQITIDHEAGVYTPGKWVDFVLSLKLSIDDGYLRGWVNGAQFVDVTGRTIGEPSADGAAFLKLGLYIPDWRVRPATGKTQQGIIGALRYAPAGAGREAVDPGCWTGAPEEPTINVALLRQLIGEGEEWLARLRAAVG